MVMRNTRVIRQLGLILGLAALGWTAAGAQDRSDAVGFYFDSAYAVGVIDGVIDPAILTGYLVLHGPSAAAGVGGWELCADIEGPAQFLSWQLEGLTVNVATPPCFAVGIGGPPLPAGENVLLATCQVLVQGGSPAVISLVPPYRATIPGRMCYLDGADPEIVIPLETTTGTDAVAWINSNTPWPAVQPSTLDCGEVALGSSVTGVVIVTNAGGGYLGLDVALADSCPEFSLVGVSGPLLLGSDQSVQIYVRFEPSAVGPFSCVLSLGGAAPDVPLAGTGRLPRIEGDAQPDTVAFGWHSPGTLAEETVTVRNLGEVSLTIEPAITGGAGAFGLGGTLGAVTIAPGLQMALTVTFAPAEVGDYLGTLELGEIVGPVALTGRGTFDSLSGTAPGLVDFGDVVVGRSVLRTFTVANTGTADFAVTPIVAQGGEVFAVVAGAGTTVLHGGGSLAVTVSLAPAAVGSCSGLLTLGQPLAPVQLQGQGVPLVMSWDAPTLIEFGPVPLGTLAERTATITNTGNVPLNLAVALPDPSVFHLLDGSGSLELPPGGSHQITLGFLPTAEEPYAGALDLGATVPAVLLTGEGRLPVMSYVLTPTALTLPTVAVGYPVYGTVTLSNTGDTVIPVAPYLMGGDPGFTPVAGFEAGNVTPGTSRSLEIRFQSYDLGTFAATLVLGPGLSEVPIAAATEAASPGCAVSPTNLAFGPVYVGQTATRYVTVTNTGNVPLTGTPTAPSHPYFTIDSAPLRVEPGGQAQIAVRFRPLTEGFWNCDIDLGIGICAEVLASGSGVPWGWSATGEDVAGVFFDPGCTTNAFNTYFDFQIVTAYLVLQNPSDPSGVAAWECCLDLDGDAQFVDFVLDGSYVNVETPPCFMVGIGGEPLPYSPNVRLATFRFLVTTAWSQVNVLLGPTRRPSLDGYSAWVPWSDLDRILPMQEFPGQVVAASVNTDMVGVEAPAPLATVTAGGVELSWQTPEASVQACHVYRRLEGGLPARLTVDPVRAQGSRFQFTDRTEGLAPGAVLHYSYAILRDGQEEVRSPETVVTLDGRPTVLTRLLPNAPNPFNPQTEIRFELQQAGPVRIAVYDLTGRRICTLVDENLSAGPGSRTWRGLDDAGRPVPSGAYYVRLETGGRIDSRKIMLLK